MTKGSLEDTLRRIAVHFLPDLELIRARIEKQKKTHPLLSMIGTARLSEGQVVARTGPAESDQEGALIASITQDIAFVAPFLSAVIDRARQRYGVTSEILTSFLYRSPIFRAPFRDLIAQGIDAYLNDDHVKAISILTPQIEAALRNLLHDLGQPPNKDWRGDPSLKMEKTLNDILEREQCIKDFLSDRGHLYLLAFLADPRGLNIRNRMGHGLMVASDFRRDIGDRVIHILALLALGTCPKEQPPHGE
jgi:hypothetical protein